jgi:hypothetical protein
MCISFDDEEIGIKQRLRKCSANSEKDNFQFSGIAKTQWFIYGNNLQASASLLIHTANCEKNA